MSSSCHGWIAEMEAWHVFDSQTQILLWIASRGGQIDDPVADRHIEWGYDNKPKRISWSKPIKTNSQMRSERLTEARRKGGHTKSEWTALADVFGQCVACGAPYEALNGGMPTKDHIIPIYIGGCDCIANLQPMCRNCNSGKPDNTDLRAAARPDWVSAYLARLANGWTV